MKGDLSHTEQELANKCDARAGVGTTSESLLHTAGETGLQLVEQKSNAEISDLERNIDDGNYVIVNYIHAHSGVGHYALVSEHDLEALYLRDPSSGFIRIKKSVFQNWWHNGDKTVEAWYASFS